MRGFSVPANSAYGRSVVAVELSGAVVFLSFFLLGMPLTGDIPEPPSLFRKPGPVHGDTALIEILVWALIYGFAAFDTIRHARQLNNARLVLPMLPLLFYAALAPFSPYLDSPMMLFLQMTGATAVSLTTARLMTRDFGGTLLLLQYATGLNLLLNIAFVVLLPVSTVTLDGRWSSLVGNPNYLGAIALVNMFCLGMRFITASTSFSHLCLQLLLPLTVLIGTASGTSILAGTMLAALLFFLEAHRLGRTAKSVLRVLSLIMVIILFVDFDYYFSLLLDWLGRDFTFSGRAHIWENTLKALSAHLLSGYGVGVDTLDVRAAGWSTNFHNGFLQIMMETGLVGLVIFLAAFLAALFGALRSRLPHYRKVVPVFLITFLVYNLAEAPVFLWRNPVWLAYCSILFYWAFRKKWKSHGAEA